MAAVTVPPRTRLVETKITEQVPASETQGLGMPCLEYLETLPDEELFHTTVKVYRMEPAGSNGFIERLQPAQRIDEAWIQSRHGGGVFAIQVKNKNGKSGYDRNIRIVGEPKPVPMTAASSAAPVAAAPNPDDAYRRMSELLDKMFDRFSTLQTSANAPSNASVAQDSVIEIMSSAAKKAVDLVGGEKRESRSAAGELTELLTLMEKLKPERDPLDAQLREAFIKRLTEPSAPPASNDPIEQITRLGSLMEVIDKLRGEGGGKGDWKTAIIEKVAEAIPTIAETVKASMDARAREATAMASARKSQADAITAVRQLQRPGTQLPQPAAPAPVAATADAPAGVSPLRVVPIEEGYASRPGSPSSADLDAVAEEEKIRQAGTVVIEEDSAMIEKWFKKRVVQLIAENADPVMLIDFIDGANPALGAMLGKFSPAQIRGYMLADPILKEATKLLNFEDFLLELVAVLRDSGQPPAAEIPPN